MKKRFLAGLLTLAMLMTLAPVAFAADDGDAVVAKIGDKTYTTLAAAVAEADGQTVILLNNVQLNSTLTLNKSFTLDLNGYVISNGNELGQNYLVSVTSGANVSIVGDKENSKIVDSRNNATGTITAIVVYGNLTVSGDNLTISRGANGIAIKVEDNPGTLTVNSGTITVDAATVTSSQAIQNWGNTTINGGTFNGDVDSYAYIYGNKDYIGNMTIENGTFNGEVFAAQLQYNNQWPTASAKVSITGGNFKGTIAEYYHDSAKGLQPVENVDKPADTAESKVVVTGGDFSTNPSAYLAQYTGEGNKKYVAGAINEAPYFFRVALVDDEQIPVVPAVGETAAPSEDDLKKAGIAEEVANAVATAAQEVTAGDTEIKEAAASVATGITDTQATAYQETAKNDVTDVEKIEVRAYLEVSPKSYNTNAYTLDITPKYDVVVVGTKDNQAAEKVVATNTLNVTKETEVSVQLPTGFIDSTNPLNTLYVQHKGHEYDATVTADSSSVYTATFTNPNGFSEFTISKTSQTVAKIGEDKYTSFADAVNAVPANGTIDITGGTSPYTGTANKTFTVKNSTSADITVNGQTIKAGESYTFKYTSSSSSGSSSTTYAVNVNAATNGTVAADKKTASKGTTVTVTATPSAGYVVEAVKVVDKDGKDVAVTVKDGKYVFTMPASAVTVTASFKAETPVPSGLPFTDVKSGDWFYDAVKYAYENGLMNGTSETIFAPNGTMNRAMIVTVLYRLEKSPAVTAAAKFTDVPAGQWYSDAVAWAAANNIVNGYDETTFGPLNAVTREQMAAILYRYEQYKGLENVTLEENLNRFPDKDKISAYAVPALQWAVGQKIINGNADGTLDPTGTATRAQVAQIFMNLLNK